MHVAGGAQLDVMIFVKINFDWKKLTTLFMLLHNFLMTQLGGRRRADTRAWLLLIALWHWCLTSAVALDGIIKKLNKLSIVHEAFSHLHNAHCHRSASQFQCIAGPVLSMVWHKWVWLVISFISIIYSPRYHPVLGLSNQSLVTLNQEQVRILTNL